MVTVLIKIDENRIELVHEEAALLNYALAELINDCPSLRNAVKLYYSVIPLYLAVTLGEKPTKEWLESSLVFLAQGKCKRKIEKAVDKAFEKLERLKKSLKEHEREIICLCKEKGEVRLDWDGNLENLVDVGEFICTPDESFCCKKRNSQSSKAQTS